VVAYSGGWFVNQVALTAADVHFAHRWAVEGLSKAVRQRHRTGLAHLQRVLPQTWFNAPLSACILHFVELLEHERNWKPQTTFREMCSIAGAFSNLPLYSNFPHPVVLSRDPQWAAAMRSRQLAASEAQPHHQLACNREQMFRAIQMEPNESIAMTLLIQWLTGCRVGCALQLQRSCLELQDDGRLAVQFRKGKGVLFRDIYTVHTAAPLDLLPRLKRHLATLESDQLLCPRIGRSDRRMSLMLAAVRRADNSLNMRSVRRGSLQTLALAGHSIETLLQFSGHTKDRTLKRYLDWGRLFGDEATRGQAAAQALFSLEH
jgi:hypothetical protein